MRHVCLVDLRRIPGPVSQSCYLDPTRYRAFILPSSH